MARKSIRNSAAQANRPRAIPDAAKGLLTLLSFLPLIAASVALGSAIQPSHNAPQQADPQLLFHGNEVSLDAAQQMVSFHIAVPTVFPRTFAHTSVRVDP